MNELDSPSPPSEAAPQLLAFSAFIEGVAEQAGLGDAAFDEEFARALGRTLDRRASELRLPEVDALHLDDVLVTLSMDSNMSLIATGNLTESGGRVTVQWKGRQFTEVVIAVGGTPKTEPYTFATLDFSVRDKKGILKQRAGVLPAGQEVILKALATIGEREEYRVVALGHQLSVLRKDLDVQDDPT